MSKKQSEMRRERKENQGNQRKKNIYYEKALRNGRKKITKEKGTSEVKEYTKKRKRENK